ncbi:MAG: XRE family transcriptional regulator [Rikenellaceae bacterium]
MNEHIKEIALRLRGLRDVLDLEVPEVAQICGVSTEQYEIYESGTVDIPVGLLYSISKHYSVEMSALLFGEEPHMDSYFLTRKDTGATVQRHKAYKYQSLAAGFAKRNANPFMVKVAPNEGDITLNTHEGQEFTMVIEGRMLAVIDGKELILEEGDSLFFDSLHPHGFKALDGKSLKFLSVII